MKVVMAFKDDDSFEDYDTSPHCNGFLRRVLQLHQASDWLRTHGAAGCCSAEFFARWIKEKKTARVRDGETKMGILPSKKLQGLVYLKKEQVLLIPSDTIYQLDSKQGATVALRSGSLVRDV